LNCCVAKEAGKSLPPTIFNLKNSGPASQGRCILLITKHFLLATAVFGKPSGFNQHFLEIIAGQR
jgi:hypothetical protein